MKREKKTQIFFGEEYPGWFNPNLPPRRRSKPLKTLPRSEFAATKLCQSVTRDQLLEYDFDFLEADCEDYDYADPHIVLYSKTPKDQPNPDFEKEMAEWREQGKKVKDWKFLKARYNRAKDLVLLKELIKKHGVPE